MIRQSVKRTELDLLSLLDSQKKVSKKESELALPKTTRILLVCVLFTCISLVYQISSHF